MQSKLWRQLYSGESGRVCGLFSTMVRLTREIAAWFSGRRRCKVDDCGLERVPAGVKYSLLEDISVHDEATALYHPADESGIRQVKQEEVCSEVLKMIDDKTVNTIALSGVRGIGKSTLLRRLESLAVASGKFSLVLRVGCDDSDGSGGNLGKKISDALYEQFGVIEKDDFLTEWKPYLFLLDDLLKPVKVSGPIFPFNMAGKIVFTTEEKRLGCPTLQVMPLDAEEALELFLEEIGEKAMMFSNVEEIEFVKSIVNKCHGLPLALKILAGAAKCGKETLGVLNEKATELNDLDTLMRFALDMLPSNFYQECFMYVALFPKNYWIPTKVLIEYWYGQNLIGNGSNDVMVAIENGNEVIDRLKTSNLLEERNPSFGNMDRAVKMLDTVRYMILYYNEEFLVESDLGLKKNLDATKSIVAKRISLMSNNIGELKEKIPKLKQLETLLLNDNLNIETLPKNFFTSMSRVKVLDQSRTSLRDVPKGICEMKSMEYLNLSFTLIAHLPKELGKLKNLKCLKLERTRTLRSFPQQLLSKFVDLQSLCMFDTGFAVNEDIITEMEHLENLKILEIQIEDFGCLDKLVKKMAERLTNVLMTHCQDEIKSINFLSSFGTMKNLKELHINNFPNLREIVINCPNRDEDKVQMPEALEKVYIFAQDRLTRFHVDVSSQCFKNLKTLEIICCPLLVDISWVSYLPSLNDLVLADNNQMDDLFSQRLVKCEDCFPMLKFMTLKNLAGLKNISHRVIFPSLENVVIFNCPNLGTLPWKLFDENSKKILQCNRDWWNTWFKGVDETAKRGIFVRFIDHANF